jgi:hypothetical protein
MDAYNYFVIRTRTSGLNAQQKLQEELMGFGRVD